MSNIKAIRTEADYNAALSRIDALMDAEPGTPAGGELDVPVDLVEHYEEKREPMGFLSAIAAIRFRMEQANLTPRGLAPFIEALVPHKIWETSTVREHPTPMAVISLANALQIHPAIVAGKVRHEQRNFRLLSQFVGTGEVRHQFGLTT